VTDLAAWLLDRIAEDEERGHSLVRQWWDVGNACQSCGTDGGRVLAECDAKRRAVAMQIVEINRILALPYADQQGYREEWRP
jgi:hypothetical protein